MCILNRLNTIFNQKLKLLAVNVDRLIIVTLCCSIGRIAWSHRHVVICSSFTWFDHMALDSVHWHTRNKKKNINHNSPTPLHLIEKITTLIKMSAYISLHELSLPPSLSLPVVCTLSRSHCIECFMKKNPYITLFDIHVILLTVRIKSNAKKFRFINNALVYHVYACALAPFCI